MRKTFFTLLLTWSVAACSTKEFTEVVNETNRTQKIASINYDFIISPETVKGKGDFRTFLQGVVATYDKVLIKNGTYEMVVIHGANGVKPKNGSTITFESNAKIKIKSNNLEYYYVFDLRGRENISIINPNLEGDKYTHQGTKGEWGHGINIANCNNVVIQNPYITKFWGDGLYINGAKNIKIHNPVLDDNRRQGISIISCENVEIYSPIISNTSGTYPAFGIVVEPNRNGEHVKNLKIYNAIFKNNGKLNNGGGFEGDFAGFCLSPHQVSKKKPINQSQFVPTFFDIELINPTFEGDQLIISASSDLVHGKLTIKNAEFRKSSISAVYILNHQSDNFKTEIINPLFHNCVQKTNLLSSYYIPMLFNCNKQGVKTTGNKNISVTNPYFIADKNAIFNKNAIRNITPSSFKEDMKNVIIDNLRIDGYEIPFYNHNGNSDPNITTRLSHFSNLDSKFTLTINSKDSKIPNFGFSQWKNSEVSKTLEKALVNVKENVSDPIIYLNENIPVSGFELYYANNSTNKVPLNLNFGTKSAPTKKTVQRSGKNQRSSKGITIPYGAHVTLVKKGANIWEIISEKSSNNIQY